MSHRPTRRTRIWLTLAVMGAGGLLPGTCMLRTRQAAIDGSKIFLANAFLNPETISDLPLDSLVSDLGLGQ